MSDLEEAIVRRVSGSKILLWSLGILVAGVSPLLLYIVLGPVNGNPIGLGLLAVVAVLLGCIGAAVGIVKVLVEYFTRAR